MNDRDASQRAPQESPDSVLESSPNGGDGTAPPVATPFQEATAGLSMDGRGGGGRRRSAYFTRDLTQGSVAGTLWFLAWPQMVEGVLNVIDQLADYFWAGRYVGFVAIAGLGVAQTYMMFLMTIRQGLDIALKAMVARAYGMGNVNLANHVVLQALTLTFVFVSFVAILGSIFTVPLLRILGVSDALVGMTTLYMRIQFIGFALVGIRMMGGAALQASGDAITPMKATTATRAWGLIAAPVFMFGGIPVFGWNWFTEMGIPGLALGHATGNVIGILWNYSALFTGTSRLKLTLRGYRVDFPIIVQLLKIGWPSALTTAERSISQLILLRFVTPFGDAAVAAYALTRRLTQVTNVGAMGMGRASGILVAQNLGAGNAQRAKETVRWAVLFVALIKGALVSLIFAFPIFVASIFNSEPELLELMVPWIRIMMIAAYGQAIALVFRQSFEVAGDTLSAMLITFIAMLAVEIPFSYFLSQHTSLGQYGIAVGISCAMVVMLALFIPYYFYGRWLRIGFKAFGQERAAAARTQPAS